MVLGKDIELGVVERIFGNVRALDSPSRPDVGKMKTEPEEWFYLEETSSGVPNAHGPFSRIAMRDWYLDSQQQQSRGDLEIKLRRWTNFHLRKDVFKDAKTAFKVKPLEPSSGIPKIMQPRAKSKKPKSSSSHNMQEVYMKGEDEIYSGDSESSDHQVPYRGVHRNQRPRVADVPEWPNLIGHLKTLTS